MVSLVSRKPLCFPVFFSFYFLMFEKKKKGKGTSKAKVLECTFAQTYILKTYEENQEIKKEDTGVTYISVVFELQWNIGRRKEGTGETEMKIVFVAQIGFMISFYFLLFGA